EVLVDRDNPRFVVTSLPIEEVSTERLYCELYCARGDMENRIKEQQFGLFADRTSARATAITVRARLFKIGALVRVSCRRIKLSISQAFPLQSLFATALTRLAPEYPLRGNR
ncbi:MAG: transposase, partial [Vicinamibacterales bacterium]|nr:transposase [Vicinamibacterales bacterium]